MSYYYPAGERPSRDYPGHMEPDAPFTCTECGFDYDLDDDKVYEYEGKRVCEECRPKCGICGGWLDDEYLYGMAMRESPSPTIAAELEAYIDSGMCCAVNYGGFHFHAFCLGRNISGEDRSSS